MRNDLRLDYVKKYSDNSDPQSISEMESHMSSQFTVTAYVHPLSCGSRPILTARDKATRNRNPNKGFLSIGAKERLSQNPDVRTKTDGSVLDHCHGMARRQWMM